VARADRRLLDQSWIRIENNSVVRLFKTNDRVGVELEIGSDVDDAKRVRLVWIFDVEDINCLSWYDMLDLREGVISSWQSGQEVC
jgi:hypothetical protein